MGNFFAKSKKAEPPTETNDATKKPSPTGNFAQDLLKAQNDMRAKHGVPTMTLSTKLNEDAQRWADDIASRDVLAHCEERNGQGENLAWASGDIGADETAKMWYDEINDYDFSKPGYNGKTGHFTQMTWKSSTEFGAGFAKSSGGATYVVGRYLPAGNMTMTGEFEKNVLPVS
ncbi:Golgi-associated plant pathogenesis-related protein 1-like isoform X2 [Clavelina lepadiformis]|uniref:SCP domain-containing protein n=1 Tax=Clavelina lepadiformis TaxID=159417 RepID=A0ABP0H0S5_CLALP